MAICRMCWADRESLTQRDVAVLGVATIQAMVCRGCMGFIQRSLNFLHLLGIEQGKVSAYLPGVQLEHATGEDPPAQEGMPVKTPQKRKRAPKAAEPTSDTV